MVGKRAPLNVPPNGSALDNRFAIHFSLPLFLYAAFAAGSGVKTQLKISLKNLEWRCVMQFKVV
jgi:hypothetical protein